MAKRFTDTDKWKKKLLKSMPAEYKLLWLYICDDCDHAGIWNVDMEIACLRIGEQVTAEKAEEIFGDKIVVFDDGEKWFIPGFIDFQYGVLNEKNRVHESILKILNKYKLLENKPLAHPVHGVKDKDMDKDMEKDKDKDKEKAKPKKKSDEDLQLLIDTNLNLLGPDFKTEWEKWKDYKAKEFKFKYKSLESESAALTELVNLSKKNKATAIAIIAKSMSSGWKGFFELEEPKNGLSSAGSPAHQPAPPVFYDQKIANEINYLYGTFLEEKCSIATVEILHYDYLKRYGLVNFPEETKTDIRRKAIDWLQEKKQQLTDDAVNRLMKKFGVLEFFQQQKDKGLEIIFNKPAA